MKRILFVEDNAMMREMYEAMLSVDGNRWEVTTVESGWAALKLMQERPFDVVASDMRMEGMSGAEFLNTVFELYPQTSRIIISGVADQAEAAAALASTHQFLVKPVNLNTLRSMLVRLDGLDGFLNDEKLKTLARRLRVLPSFPQLYLEITKAIEDPYAPLQTISGLLIKDPGLTAKILQIANSAAIGLREKVSDPLDAVRLLGLNTVRSLALSAHVFTSYTAAQKINFPVDKLWTHLMRCGNTARAIMRAEYADLALVDAAYTAGILHDIGKLMLADNLPQEFQKVLTEATTNHEPFHQIEMSVFGADHAGLAAYLLGLWGLPATIVEAVAFHHTPGRSSYRKLSPLTAVHVANALEHELDGESFSLNKSYLASIGMSDRLDVWREEARKLREEK